MSKRLLIGAFSCLTLAAPAASALTIEYTATDLADESPGADLWRYDYAVSGAIGGQPFAANQAFAIYFDAAQYRSLRNPLAPNASWLTFVLQPDPLVPPAGVPGEFDAVAAVNQPPITGLFSVEFLWLGRGAPASQPFDVLAFDQAGQFLDLLESGVTQPPISAVPEPASVLLVGTGLGLLARRRARQGSTSARNGSSPEAALPPSRAAR